MSTEPLTIYECPNGCGHRRCPADGAGSRQACRCSPSGGLVLMVPIRVFREEAVVAEVEAMRDRGPTWDDVRPLWEAARTAAAPEPSPLSRAIDKAALGSALDAFAAPEEWTA